MILCAEADAAWSRSGEIAFIGEFGRSNLIAYATLVVSGGRLGDISGTKTCSSPACPASPSRRCGAGWRNPAPN
jgi:hypothetical protein